MSDVQEALRTPPVATPPKNRGAPSPAFPPKRGVEQVPESASPGQHVMLGPPSSPGNTKGGGQRGTPPSGGSGGPRRTVASAERSRGEKGSQSSPQKRPQTAPPARTPSSPGSPGTPGSARVDGRTVGSPGGTGEGRGGGSPRGGRGDKDADDARKQTMLRLGIKNVAQLQLPGLALAKSIGDAESRATLECRVVSESRKEGISRAAVSLCDMGGWEQQRALTDTSGRVRLVWIPGRWQIHVDKTKYEPYRGEIVLERGVRRDIVVEMGAAFHSVTVDFELQWDHHEENGLELQVHTPWSSTVNPQSTLSKRPLGFGMVKFVGRRLRGEKGGVETVQVAQAKNGTFTLSAKCIGNEEQLRNSGAQLTLRNSDGETQVLSLANGDGYIAEIPPSSPPDAPGSPRSSAGPRGGVGAWAADGGWCWEIATFDAKTETIKGAHADGTVKVTIFNVETGQVVSGADVVIAPGFLAELPGDLPVGCERLAEVKSDIDGVCSLSFATLQASMVLQCVKEGYVTYQEVFRLRDGQVKEIRVGMSLVMKPEEISFVLQQDWAGCIDAEVLPQADLFMEVPWGTVISRLCRRGKEARGVGLVKFLVNDKESHADEMRQTARVECPSDGQFLIYAKVFGGTVPASHSTLSVQLSNGEVGWKFQTDQDHGFVRESDGTWFIASYYYDGLGPNGGHRVEAIEPVTLAWTVRDLHTQEELQGVRVEAYPGLEVDGERYSELMASGTTAPLGEAEGDALVKALRAVRAASVPQNGDSRAISQMGSTRTFDMEDPVWGLPKGGSLSGSKARKSFSMDLEGGGSFKSGSRMGDTKSGGKAERVKTVRGNVEGTPLVIVATPPYGEGGGFKTPKTKNGAPTVTPSKGQGFQTPRKSDTMDSKERSSRPVSAAGSYQHSDGPGVTGTCAVMKCLPGAARFTFSLKGYEVGRQAAILESSERREFWLRPAMIPTEIACLLWLQKPAEMQVQICLWDPSSDSLGGTVIEQGSKGPSILRIDTGKLTSGRYYLYAHFDGDEEGGGGIGGVNLKALGPSLSVWDYLGKETVYKLSDGDGHERDGSWVICSLYGATGERETVGSSAWISCQAVNLFDDIPIAGAHTVVTVQRTGEEIGWGRTDAGGGYQALIAPSEPVKIEFSYDGFTDTPVAVACKKGETGEYQDNRVLLPPVLGNSERALVFVSSCEDHNDFEFYLLTPWGETLHRGCLDAREPNGGSKAGSCDYHTTEEGVTTVKIRNSTRGMYYAYAIYRGGKNIMESRALLTFVDDVGHCRVFEMGATSVVLEGKCWLALCIDDGQESVIQSEPLNVRVLDKVTNKPTAATVAVSPLLVGMQDTTLVQSVHSEMTFHPDYPGIQIPAGECQFHSMVGPVKVTVSKKLCGDVVDELLLLPGVETRHISRVEHLKDELRVKVTEEANPVGGCDVEVRHGDYPQMRIFMRTKADGTCDTGIYAGSVRILVSKPGYMDLLSEGNVVVGSGLDHHAQVQVGQSGGETLQAPDVLQDGNGEGERAGQANGDASSEDWRNQAEDGNADAE